MNVLIKSIEGEYRRYKTLAESALEQVAEAQLSAAGPANGNSLAIMCWHVSGNLRSRFTDFLTAARAVTVIAVNENRGDTGERSSDQIVSHLARRGIKARVERLTADRGNVHGTILSIAADSNIGLLVMGGFGHSRLQERILGGVTRGMLESM